MNWGSVSAFLAMGGYGLYVWGSFGACALVLALEPLFVSRREAAALRSLRIRLRAEHIDKETP